MRQNEVLEATKAMRHGAYFLNMGLGKTCLGSEKMMEIGNRGNKARESSLKEFLGKYDGMDVTDPSEERELV